MILEAAATVSTRRELASGSRRHDSSSDKSWLLIARCPNIILTLSAPEVAIQVET